MNAVLGAIAGLLVGIAAVLSGYAGWINARMAHRKEGDDKTSFLVSGSAGLTTNALAFANGLSAQLERIQTINEQQLERINGLETRLTALQKINDEQLRRIGELEHEVEKLRNENAKYNFTSTTVTTNAANPGNTNAKRRTVRASKRAKTKTRG